MTLQSSGAISINDIKTELGIPLTTPLGLMDSVARNLAGIPSGAISLFDFYGKSNRKVVNLTISSNTQNYNIFNNVANAYIAGKTDVTLTINSGVVVGSSSTGSAALVTGLPGANFTTGDTLTIINNGSIVGAGGQGGNGANLSASQYSGTTGGNGIAGGQAMSISFPTLINNLGTIGGGGGGGGGGASYTYLIYSSGGSGSYSWYNPTYIAGAGGGGGGAGSVAGIGGLPSQNMGDFPARSNESSTPTSGANGTTTSGGGGGNMGGVVSVGQFEYDGGAGGNGGALGNSGSSGNYARNGGVGLGGYGTIYAYGGTGGAGGVAVSGGSNVTWLNKGTLNGAITG